MNRQLAVAGSVLCLSGLILALLVTSLGARLTLHLVESAVDGLELDYWEGTIIDELYLKRLTFQQQELRVDGKHVKVEIELACLLRKTICINNLSAEDFQLVYLSPIDTGSFVEQLRTSIVGFSDTLPDLALPFKMQITDLCLANAKLEMPDSVHHLTNVSLSALWGKQSIQIQQMSMVYAELGSLELDGGIEFERPHNLDLQFDVDIQSIPEWPELGDTHAEIRLEGNFRQLSYKIESDGPLEMQAEGDAKLNAENLPFTLNLQASRLPLPTNHPMLITPSSVKLIAEGDLRRQQLQLEAVISGFDYEGLDYDNVKLGAELVHTTQRIEIDRLVIFDPYTKSEASLSGSLNYGQGITWKTTLKLKNFVLPDLVPVQGKFTGGLNSEGMLVDGKWNLALTDASFNGSVNGLPATVSGGISFNDLWQIPESNIHVELNDLIFDMQGFTDDQWHVTGSLNARSLKSWQDDLQGRGLVKIDVSGDLREPIISLDGEMAKFSWRYLTIPALSLKARYQPMNNQLFFVELGAENLVLDDLGLEDVELLMKGDTTGQDLHLYSAGEIDSELALSGNWLDREKRWQGQFFENSSVAYENLTLVLQDTVNLDFDTKSAELSLTAHCWQGKSHSICVKEDMVLGQSGRAHLAIDTDLAVFNRLFLSSEVSEVEVETTVSGEVSVVWSPNIDSDLSLEAQGGFFIEPGHVLFSTENGPLEVMEWQAGEFNFGTDGNSANISFSLKEEQRSLVDFDMQLSEQWQQIDGQIILSGLSLVPVASYIDELRRLDGVVSADVAFTGSPMKPDLNGQLQVDGARIELVAAPSPMEPVSLNLNFEGSQATLDGEFFVGENRASLNGHASWDDQFTLNMNLDAEQLDVVYPPSLIATIKPKLFLSLQPSKLTLTGQIDVLSGRMAVDDLEEGAVAPSRDQVFVDENIGDSRKPDRFDIEANIVVVIDEQFQLEGGGFRSQLGGKVQLVHEHDLLQMFGSLKLHDGLYSAYGQNLDITRGEISFNGPLVNPHIDLEAVRKIPRENVTVGVQISGQIDNPDLSFFSQPVMEPSEVMSYLVRGRDFGSGVGDSAVLSMALGATNNFGIFQELEAASMINNIQIDTEGDGNQAQATISGFVGERLYLKYGVGVYEPINELTVRIYFLNRLWLETVSGLNSSADLYYSFEIE